MSSFDSRNVRDYDKEYYKYDKHPWQEGGDAAIASLVDVMRVSGDVLDLGFGTGRHSVAFAKYGCVLDSCDISKFGARKLISSANSFSLPINVYTQDLFRFVFKKQYDIIFSYMSLQYAENKASFDSMIGRMKKWTKPGGVNYVRLPMLGISVDFPFILESLDELKERYGDWDILLSSSESKVLLSGKNSSHMLLVARKPEVI